MVTKVVTYLGVLAAGALAVLGYLAWTEPHTSAPTSSADAARNTSQGAVIDKTQDSGVTLIRDVTRNTMVTVSGTVQRITDEDEFVLEDPTGTISVWTGSQFFTVTAGEAIMVTGFIDDDLLLELYAQEITRADGTVLTIGGSGDR